MDQPPSSAAVADQHALLQVDAAATAGITEPAAGSSSSADAQPARKKQRVQETSKIGGLNGVNDSAVASSSSSSSSSSSASAPAAAAPPAPLRVVIIGGGLAGLSCALSLQRVGIACKVFERDLSAGERKQGFGLTLTNSPVGALAQLGLLDECLRRDCPSTCHWVFDSKGEVLGYYGRAFLTQEEVEAKRNKVAVPQISAPEPVAPMDVSASTASSASSSSSSSVVAAPIAPVLVSAENNDALPLPSPSPAPSPLPSPSPSPPPSNWFSSANLRIPRQDLRQLLLERLAPDTVTWGAKVLDYIEDSQGVTISFADGSQERCDILVGADGINSIIRRLQDTKSKEKVGGLKYTGVAAIIGISPATHPLLDARGFYTMGNRHRLFTMPFRRALLSAEDGRVLEPALTMWQLSFAEESEEKARALNATPSEELLAMALQRTEGWMHPVHSLLAATPLANVWATALCDRDARRLRTKQQASRVTVVGDACHPMAMFKGQGANQALQDGPLLAHHLTCVDRNTPRAALDSAGRPLLTPAGILNRIRRFEAQMVQRSASRVLASRKAAEVLHSSAASEASDMYGVGGVALSSAQLSLVLQRCRERGVGAQLEAQLDATFASLLDETVPPSERDASLKAPREDML